MTYLTTWDINVVLCLVYWGLPDDVVKGMLKTTKKVHEKFSFREAAKYWNSNSLRLNRLRLSKPLERNGVSLRFQLNENIEFSQTRVNVFHRRHKVNMEFKLKWRLRSIEERKKKVIDWCKFGDDFELGRHQERLTDQCRCGRLQKRGESHSEWIKRTTMLRKEREEYTKNLWATWDAWPQCEHPQIYSPDAIPIDSEPWVRRSYIGEWYNGIHPGRFFLFYKENKIIEQRNYGKKEIPSPGVEYVYPKTPIFDWGPYEQLIQDLLTIDGPGLGESSEKGPIEHIDDIFQLKKEFHIDDNYHFKKNIEDKSNKRCGNFDFLRDVLRYMYI